MAKTITLYHKALGDTRVLDAADVAEYNRLRWDGYVEKAESAKAATSPSPRTETPR